MQLHSHSLTVKTGMDSIQLSILRSDDLQVLQGLILKPCRTVNYVN